MSGKIENGTKKSGSISKSNPNQAIIQNKDIKIVLVGDAQTGKTNIILSYLKNICSHEYITTVFDNYSANLQIDQENVNLTLWDTSGEPQYKKLGSLSYHQTDIFLIVFSVTDQNSLENALLKYYPEVSQSQPQALKIFVGAKIDLRNKNINTEIAHSLFENSQSQTINYETAEKLINFTKCQYLECSAVTQEGLKNMFDQAIKLHFLIKDLYSKKK